MASLKWLLCCLMLFATNFGHSNEAICNAMEYEIGRVNANSIMNTPMEVVPNEPFLVPSKTIILNQKDPNVAKDAILRYFLDTYDLFTSLHLNVKDEYFWTRGDPLRHPIGWYAGHCAAFYLNKFRLVGIVSEPVNNHFESLFAVGVDEMSWDDKLEDRENWPNVDKVYEYRQQVRQFITQTIQELPLALPITWDSVWWAVLMGIEHDRVHLETSSVLFRQLPIDVLKKPIGVWANECNLGIFNNNSHFIPNLGNNNDRHSPENELIGLKSVVNMEYGREFDSIEKGEIYGWDNEFGTAIARDVPSFNASKYLVSNEEFYEFVLDGGYRDSEFWTEEGWNWVTTTNTEYPKFWIKQLVNNNNNNNEFVWQYRTMLNIIDLPWDWPALTNQLESHAFTQWKSMKTGKNIRLPTEDEYYVLRKGVGLSQDRLNSCQVCNQDTIDWDIAPGNVNLEFFTSEAPVDMFPFGDTGFYDIVGNVWQHTLTPLHALDGFEVHPLYDDYTVPFIGKYHNMIKGGSWASSGTYGSVNTRTWFRRHFFQNAGFRYVESDRDLSFLKELAESPSDADDDMIHKHTHLHYCDEPYFGVPNYAKTVADIAIKNMNSNMTGRALDLGCGTGRTTYELAKVFDHVTGLDYTARLIGVGYRLAEQGYLEWEMPHHGSITEHYKVTLSDLGLNDNVTQKVYFAQNDAQNLDLQYSNYDLVVASNLIDQLANPLLFLNGIHDRVNHHGKLILLSPYLWEEGKTSPERWIGGKYCATTNKPIETFDALQDILNQWFVLENEEEVEMVQRETKRTYQHSMIHCTIWKKL